MTIPNTRSLDPGSYIYIYTYCDPLWCSHGWTTKTAVLYDINHLWWKESWPFFPGLNPAPRFPAGQHKTPRKHSWQPCQTSLRRHPKKMSVDTPDFPIVKLARNTSKTSELRSHTPHQSILIRDKEWSDPSKTKSEIKLRKLNHRTICKTRIQTFWNVYEFWSPRALCLLLPLLWLNIFSSVLTLNAYAPPQNPPPPSRRSGQWWPGPQHKVPSFFSEKTESWRRFYQLRWADYTMGWSPSQWKMKSYHARSNT